VEFGGRIGNLNMAYVANEVLSLLKMVVNRLSAGGLGNSIFISNHYAFVGGCHLS
jgi:hypothetical protein